MVKSCKIAGFIATILALSYTYNQNQISRFKVRDVQIKSHKISDNIKITHISDFHSNKHIDLDKLVGEIAKFDPDIIVLTGDMIDSGDEDLSTVFLLFEKVSELNKNVYFVYGNHEVAHKYYDQYKIGLRKHRINILEDESETIIVRGETINVIGLNYRPKVDKNIEREIYTNILESIDQSFYNILLIHSPTNIEELIRGKEDLVLSGHTHGGQIRLPYIGAIISPGQGLFPKLNKGLYNFDKTSLYIDSGLGNSKAPIRMFNPVQISNITISAFRDI